MSQTYTYGKLRYNVENERYGVSSNGSWVEEGLHCGERLEVKIDGSWVPVRIELGEDWYLAGTPYRGKKLENMPARIIV